MHAVNLKAAWEATDADSQAPPIRVSLPLEWSAIPWPDGRAPARARLARRFGRPPLQAPAPAFRLRLRGFAGVEAVEFNGSPITWREEKGCLVVEPGELLPRNVLSVRVNLKRAMTASGPWGVEACLECG
jgi:hypothetical protein